MEFLAQLHPRIVHFPIAFFIFYFFIETSGIVLRKDFLLKAAYIILIAGVVTSLFAVLSGNKAQEIAKLLLKENSKSLTDLIEQHEEFATITLWYFTAVLFFRTYLMVKKKFETSLKYILIILGLLGFYLIYMTGLYGGNLVFKYGLGTQIFGK